MTPDITVILCTYNPDPDLLAQVVSSLDRQTFDHSRFEVIIVDNNSHLPLSQEDYSGGKGYEVRVVREEKQGLVHARVCGIHHSRARLIVFVDDDNILDDNYLDEAYGIYINNEAIGLYGGIARPVYECDVPEWKQGLSGFLGVRDHGTEAVTSDSTEWGIWEPIGAGMAARIEVAQAFARFVEQEAMSGGIGRSGSSLMSNEDTLFARVANREGFSCSYQPSLVLQHHIKCNRFDLGYLCRMMFDYGRSRYRLEKIISDNPTYLQLLREFVAILPRLLVYTIRYKRAGVIRWLWGLGYIYEYLSGSSSVKA